MPLVDKKSQLGLWKRNTNNIYFV